MFRFAIASLFLAATSVLAQNAITQPAGGSVTAGTNFLIEWDQVTGPTVDLDLGNGPSGNVNIIENIATGIANTGSFQWPVPASIAAGSDYTIKISWNNGTDYNFSARFTIISTVSSTSSASSSTTSSSTTSSGTSTTSAASGSASASGSGSASGSASATSTVQTVTRSTSTGATFSPPSVSSRAARFASSNLGGIFVVLAALALGMIVVV